MKKYINSNQKRKEGERELARLLKQYGYACRRGQQYCGAQGDVDVIGLPGIHIECKRVEKLDLEKAMQQAVSDARNIALPLDSFIDAYQEAGGVHGWVD